jgi:hypothetical protein
LVFDVVSIGKKIYTSASKILSLIFHEEIHYELHKE